MRDFEVLALKGDGNPTERCLTRSHSTTLLIHLDTIPHTPQIPGIGHRWPLCTELCVFLINPLFLVRQLYYLYRGASRLLSRFNHVTNLFVDRVMVAHPCKHDGLALRPHTQNTPKRTKRRERLRLPPEGAATAPTSLFIVPSDQSKVSYRRNDRK
jgi:hypothetical protein